MGAALTEPFTVADYRAFPEGPPYYQLIEGELIMSPSPNRFHRVVARNVFRLLDGFVRRQPIGEVYFAPVDVYLSDTTVVQPDVLFISAASRGLLVDEGIRGGPDLVVEIVSPGNAQLDLRRKRPLYARHGVKEWWLVDPVLEQIHRYDFAVDVAKPVRIVDGGETFETTLLPGLVVGAIKVFKR
jgi:Uma2 family endonuclease